MEIRDDNVATLSDLSQNFSGIQGFSEINREFLECGLTDKQVLQSRGKFGRNELTPPKRDPWWKDLLGKFDDPTIWILLVAAVLSLVVTAVERWALGNAEVSFVDSAGIFMAVSLATLAGFFSEQKSAREFELLNRVKDDITIKVQRNGQLCEIPIGDVVVGDLVRVDRGDKVPADGLLIDSTNLFVDQSMLTGESLPVRKRDRMLPISSEFSDQELSISDETAISRGTMVVDGHGFFLVTSVGDRTQMGKISQSLAGGDGTTPETPLVAKLSVLAKQISIAGVVGAMGIFMMMGLTALWKSELIWFLARYSALLAGVATSAAICAFLVVRFAFRPFFASMKMELKSPLLQLLCAIPTFVGVSAILLGICGMTGLGMAVSVSHTASGLLLLKSVLLAFVVAVTIIVVAVPEGLPMMVTVSLALNMMKMAKQNCLVRKLMASETIGSATVVCTDKTGTLTQNRMRPVWIFAGGEEYTQDRFDSFQNSRYWNELVDGVAINSTADLHVEHADDPTLRTVSGIGNPTECSLLAFLDERGTDYHLPRHSGKTVFEVTHQSERKFSVVVSEKDDGKTCFMKGAPERVLDKCSTVLMKNGEEPMMAHQDTIASAISRASDQALRVLAFARKRITNCDGCDNNDPDRCVKCPGMTFIGMIGIADPVREEVPAAVRVCQEAGVQVKMITGDALPTAVAIAREAGIYHDLPNETVMTSEEFGRISDEELAEAASCIRVLARSTPMDKLRMVRALHRTGMVVAMTGDGTNDAPALKSADVGLSMGITGTEVAKEASDIVLVDDNFRSIVTGIWWGRTLFQNIQRFLQFQLSVNVVALLCALIGPLVGVPLPLTVTQLLWINIIMDTFAALALSTDPPRPQTMKKPPIPRDAHIITHTMGVSILVVSVWQVAILFGTLFLGWFTDSQHHYDFTIAPTSSGYLEHNRQALTVFFTVLIMFQFWHKINCRALRHDESPFTMILKNRMFIGIVATITLVQVIMVQTPTIGRFFRTEPLQLWQWSWILLITASVIPVAWFGKMLAYWLEQK